MTIWDNFHAAFAMLLPPLTRFLVCVKNFARIFVFGTRAGWGEEAARIRADGPEDLMQLSQRLLPSAVALALYLVFATLRWTDHAAFVALEMTAANLDTLSLPMIKMYVVITAVLLFLMLLFFVGLYTSFRLAPRFAAPGGTAAPGGGPAMEQTRQAQNFHARAWFIRAASSSCKIDWHCNGFGAGGYHCRVHLFPKT